MVIPLFLHTFQNSSLTSPSQVFDTETIDAVLQLVLNCGSGGSSVNVEKMDSVSLQRSTSVNGVEDAEVASFTSMSALNDSSSAAKRPGSSLGQAIYQSSTDSFRIEMLKVCSYFYCIIAVLTIMCKLRWQRYKWNILVDI